MKNIVEAKEIIEFHDLTKVINRLVDIDGWKRDHAISACRQYRNYLYLKLLYGDQYELPPSEEIDDVWHAHILHTEDYIHFCNKAFGEYLHHHPHTKKGTLPEKQLGELFEKETQILYFDEFGEYIYAIKPNLKRKLKGIAKRLFSIREFYNDSNTIN